MDYAALGRSELCISRMGFGYAPMGGYDYRRLQQPGVAAALTGIKRAAQVDENAGATGWQLEPEELAELSGEARRMDTPLTQWGSMT